jgi:CheY-like chemotaxis protein
VSLAAIRDVILKESSATAQLQDALDRYTQLATQITGIAPDPSFHAWATDSFLNQGVAINPQAAAHCAKDYHRSVVFIRGVHAAIETLRHKLPGETIRVLYAGSGPYATLLLPLLDKYAPTELDICLLDIHQRSLDGVQALINHFGLDAFELQLVCADATNYQHDSSLHLIITETMQKALEQEPQFAVTANLATQLHSEGLFLPETIEVTLAMAGLQQAQTVSLGPVLTLSANSAPALRNSAICNQSSSTLELPSVRLQVPALDEADDLEIALFTNIQVFQNYWLHAYDAEITLPQRCHDISSVQGGDIIQVTYQLGSYPRFHCVVDTSSI